MAHPVELVVPISFAPGGKQLHQDLRYYKDSYWPDSQPPKRRRLASILGYFFAIHGGCIRAAAGSDWDIMVSVPSSARRGAPHPLTRVVDMVSWPGKAPRIDALEPRDDSADHREASETAFSAISGVKGEAVLLVDDTFTTGARIQSAAHALTVAGADVVAAAVIGRFVNTDWHLTNEEWLRRLQVDTPFDWGTCCLE